MRPGLARIAACDVLEDLRPAAARILEVQSDAGAIAWFEEGPWDPWNHVECAMALTALGYTEAAGAAFDYLADTQRTGGAWLGEYGNALPMVERDFISREPAPALVDSNFCAYPAVGIAHYLEVTGDLARVRGWWPMVRRALDFVLSLQRADGTVSWSLEAAGSAADDALLAGNASIAKALECGIFLGQTMGADCAAWRAARAALVDALANRPELFDRRGTGARFAMDWYYPVLAGALAPPAARARIAGRWDDFIEAGIGCRCVVDEPWVTTAETAELVMALLVAGEAARAAALFDTLLARRDPSGVFWMGWQCEEAIIWPREQPSWTQAAVILAAEALGNQPRGGNLLTRRAGS